MAGHCGRFLAATSAGGIVSPTQVGCWSYTAFKHGPTSHGSKLSTAQFVGAVNLWRPCHFTQGTPSPVMRVRLVGVGACVPVPVAGTVVTAAAAVVVVVGDSDV
jgi:hypothetical protein